MWSVTTVLQGLISFMVETAPTLGSIETTLSQKKKFARHSLESNIKDEQFRKLFPELVLKSEEIMMERIKLLGEQRVLKEKEEFAVMNRSEKKEDEVMQGVLAVLAGFVALLSVLFAMRIL